MRDLRKIYNSHSRTGACKRNSSEVCLSVDVMSTRNLKRIVDICCFFLKLKDCEKYHVLFTLLLSYL